MAITKNLDALSVISLIALGMFFGFFFTLVYYASKYPSEIQRVECKDEVYQLLVENKNQSVEWIQTNKKCNN